MSPPFSVVYLANPISVIYDALLIKHGNIYDAVLIKHSNINIATPYLSEWCLMVWVASGGVYGENDLENC